MIVLPLESLSAHKSAKGLLRSMGQVIKQWFKEKREQSLMNSEYMGKKQFLRNI